MSPERRDSDGAAQMPRRRWYVAETAPRKEDVALINLERQAFRCFCPRIQTTRKHARRAQTVLAPLFPGYVFVNFDADSDPWRSINGTTGVRRLITFDQAMPRPMPDQAMALLLDRYGENGEAPAIRDLQVGEAVLIISGPFAQQHARVESLDDKRRVHLLIEILGGSVRLSLGADRLLPLSDE